MDFNYTLRYRTFDQLLDDVMVDFQNYSLENMIEPNTLIKVAKKINYDLGLRLNQTKEVLLEVNHGRVKLPDDFYVFNYALICTDVTVNTGYNMGGTNIQEVPYTEVPANPDLCSEPSVNCSVCNANPCNHTAACSHNTPVTNYSPGQFDPNSPYGDTCIKPRVFINCKGDAYELIQILPSGHSYTYNVLLPLKMKSSQSIECDCPNLYFNVANEGWIKDGFLFTNFTTGKVYLNYQGALEDDEGNLLVPDHDLLNDYYEYALKKKILENLHMNDENVVSKLNYIVQEFRVARNQALNLVNMPNFKELEKIWQTNRKAMYGKYYDMFKSYPTNNMFNQHLRH